MLFVLATVLLSACGGLKNSYVGNWCMTGLERDGEAIEDEAILADMESTLWTTIALESDGRAIVRTSVGSYIGTWETNVDETVTLTSGTATMELYLENGYLKQRLDENGFYVAVYTRE